MNCCVLTNEEVTNMAMPPFDAEIFDALKAIKPYKALGPDGLHIGFFYKHWLYVGIL